jgi:hypothetical protein
VKPKIHIYILAVFLALVLAAALVILRPGSVTVPVTTDVGKATTASAKAPTGTAQQNAELTASSETNRYMQLNDGPPIDMLVVREKIAKEMDRYKDAEYTSKRRTLYMAQLSSHTKALFARQGINEERAEKIVIVKADAKYGFMEALALGSSEQASGYDREAAQAGLKIYREISTALDNLLKPNLTRDQLNRFEDYIAARRRLEGLQEQLQATTEPLDGTKIDAIILDMYDNNISPKELNNRSNSFWERYLSKAQSNALFARGKPTN